MQQRDNVGNNIIIPNSTEERKLLVRCMILTGTLLVLDQITKAVIEKYITSPVPVIPHFFDIVKVYNTGAAWGIFAGQRWPLLTISILFFLFSIFMRESWQKDGPNDTIHWHLSSVEFLVIL
jgi:lipoprotein signal peptidase